MLYGEKIWIRELNHVLGKEKHSEFVDLIHSLFLSPDVVIIHFHMASLC